MAFDKLIISRIVAANKNSAKLNSSIDSLTKKSIDDVVLPIEDKSFLILPFNVKNILEDKDQLPELTPELLSQIPTVTSSQKNELTEVVDKMIIDLNKNIVSKNKFQSSLSTITSSLKPLIKISNTLEILIPGLKTGINAIKLIPTPSSVPPGVGIPLNVIILLCNSLDILKSILEKSEGPLSTIPPGVEQISSTLRPLVTKLNNLDSIFEKNIKIISLIKSFLDQSDINQTLNELSLEIQESLSLSDEELQPQEQLKFNSNDPLFYKGFKLEIELDPENKFSFPSRRAKGINEKNVVLYNIEGGLYSFSSSPQVLIEELKFNIDRYLDN